MRITLITVLVTLSLFPKLRRISWSSMSRGGPHDGFILQIAATQLCSAVSSCGIEEVHLNIKTTDYEPFKDCCKRIDETLTSDKFLSLRSVRLFKDIPGEYFPTLQSRRLLGSWGWFGSFALYLSHLIFHTYSSSALQDTNLQLSWVTQF